MGRPPSPPEKPDGRYHYSAVESDPPEGLHRREAPSDPPDTEPEPDRSFPPAPIIRHHQEPEIRYRHPPPLAKQITTKAVMKVVEWAVGAACVAGLAWLTTRASTASVQAVAASCASASVTHIATEKELRDQIEQERQQRIDAGFALGETWNKQDAINRHVWELTRKKRDETPPPALGPKAHEEGRQ